MFLSKLYKNILKLVILKKVFDQVILKWARAFGCMKMYSVEKKEKWICFKIKSSLKLMDYLFIQFLIRLLGESFILNTWNIKYLFYLFQ